MKRTSPTMRSLKLLRANGWSAHIVEKWIPPRGAMKFGVRIDAFSFGDILVMRPPMEGLSGSIALVQCTSDNGGNMAAHERKIRAIPEFEIWKAASGRVFLQGWKKSGPRGKVKRWNCREIEL